MQINMEDAKKEIAWRKSSKNPGTFIKVMMKVSEREEFVRYAKEMGYTNMSQFVRDCVKKVMAE